MNANYEKIKTYVGFAIKSNNVCIGFDKIVAGKNSKVVLMSLSISRSFAQKLKIYAKLNNINILEFEESEFYKITQNENIKAIGITDKNLSDAINKNVTE